MTVSAVAGAAMRIEGVSNLEFGDTALVWKGRSLPYRDVASVSWSATVTQNSINGIPTGKSYDASLILFTSPGPPVSIFGDNGVLGGLGKKGFEGLAQAAEIISELTFAHRVSRFEKRLRERRYFIYGDYQFHASGEVFHKGVEKCSLLSPKTKLQLNNVFELTIFAERQDKSLLGFFKGNQIKLNLHADRDCLLYMLRSAYGITFPNVRIRQKKYSPRETFYEAVVKFGALLAASDGKAETTELLRLKQFFDLSSETFPEAAELYNSQLQDPQSAEEILEAFSDCFSEAHELKETFLFGMAEVAMSDGLAHPKEVSLLKDAIRILGIDEAVAVRILESAGIAAPSDFRRSSTASSGPLTRSRCLAILGLSIGASEDDIRAAYRELVRRYHPDVLRSQNLPSAELQRLGILMRRINEAYSWLKDGP